MFKRELGSIEQASALMDQFSPLTITFILHLMDAPPPEVLRQALNIIQKRHPLLGMQLVQQKRRYYLQAIKDPPPIPLQVVARHNDEQWRIMAETDLNNRIDVSKAPLVKCSYIYDDGKNTRSELIFTSSHLIIDGVSGQKFLQELLALCATIQTGKTPETGSPWPPLPSLEGLYPPRYQGLARLRHLIPFILRQMGEEIRYRRKLGRKQRPPTTVRSQNRIITMQLSEEVTTRLVKSAGQKHVTLNSALNAALVLAVNKHCYARQNLPMRSFMFISLRPFLEPPLSTHQLGLYFSMIQHITHIGADKDFWTLAAEFHHSIHRALQQGDIFMASLMNKQLIRFLTTFKSVRMGMTALSYVGRIEVEQSFGVTRLLGFDGFVANNVLGPEYVGTAHIMYGKLRWSMQYLDSDMDHTTAQAIADEIRDILERVI
jgi:hypothetical protein